MKKTSGGKSEGESISGNQIKGNFDAIKMGRENRKHVSYPYEKMPGSKYLLPSIS